MGVREIPRRIEGWEFQELLRELAAKTSSGVTIPQKKHPSKQAIQAPQRKHMFDPNRNVRVSSLGA